MYVTTTEKLCVHIGVHVGWPWQRAPPLNHREHAVVGYTHKRLVATCVYDVNQYTQTPDIRSDRHCSRDQHFRCRPPQVKITWLRSYATYASAARTHPSTHRQQRTTTTTTTTVTPTTAKWDKKKTSHIAMW
eukprot:m.940177 g.940177  ORF g.940177 m.940177 type:complete len:132 (-) comp23825_c1_seq14:2006-2401(-)